MITRIEFKKRRHKESDTKCRDICRKKNKIQADGECTDKWVTVMMREREGRRRIVQHRKNLTAQLSSCLHIAMLCHIKGGRSPRWDESIFGDQSEKDPETQTIG